MFLASRSSRLERFLSRSSRRVESSVMRFSLSSRWAESASRLWLRLVIWDMRSAWLPWREVWFSWRDDLTLSWADWTLPRVFWRRTMSTRRSSISCWVARHPGRTSPAEAQTISSAKRPRVVKPAALLSRRLARGQGGQFVTGDADGAVGGLERGLAPAVLLPAVLVMLGADR